jgi:cytochrome bd-type quinol oxidase subunit 1
MHTVAALPIFLGIPAAALVCAWRFHRSGRQGWALYSSATSVSMLTSMGLANAGFGQAPRLTDHAGLFQRAAIATGFAWLTALSVRARQKLAESESEMV